MSGRWDQWMILWLYRAVFSLAITLFVVMFPLWLFSPKRRATLASVGVRPLLQGVILWAALGGLTLAAVIRWVA